ncbi:hypothetical protein [Elioraea sp.]|uniref:hypothetical protein n=1 Tax=Elioraea sp. TaxID=2185103 RepID=UPI003F710A72
MRAILLGLLLVLATAPAAAQRGGVCPVAVAFEHLRIRSLTGLTNYYHAVVVIDGDAFEGNPSGRFPSWGHLVGRHRSLRAKPLKDGNIYRLAGQLPRGCTDVIAAARDVTARVNAAHLPYSPTPEIVWNAVNSNSYAHYLVRKLGLRPPPPPFPPTSGWVPGYHAAIRD